MVIYQYINETFCCINLPQNLLVQEENNFLHYEADPLNHFRE